MSSICICHAIKRFLSAVPVSEFAAIMLENSPFYGSVLKDAVSVMSYYIEE